MTWFVVNIVDKDNYQIQETQLLLTAINFPAKHEIPPHFMGTAISSPYSQQSITSLCPEPDQSSPNSPPSPAIYLGYILILSYLILLGLASGRFTSNLRTTRTCRHVFCQPYVLHTELLNGPLSFVCQIVSGTDVFS